MARNKPAMSRKSVRWLRVNLTTLELLEAGKTFADRSIAAAALEADRKRVADDFKAKLSALEAEAGILASKISTGYEFRNVACHELLGLPKPGLKTVVRLDLSETIGVEDMTQSDKQPDLLVTDLIVTKEK